VCPARETSAEQSITALLICGYDSGHQLLREVFRGLGWRLLEVGDSRSAPACLHQDLVHVVIASSDPGRANWKEILEHVSGIKPSPIVIVTSRVADDYLWAEVLNMGGFDVLAQPFDRTEVERVLASACRQASARRHSNPQLARAARLTFPGADGST
jgi:DNA-binding NtrC family response regulator